MHASAVTSKAIDPVMNLKDKISKESLPRHIAIIMDGNGRWARKQGLARTAGHETGVRAVRETVETAAELGISYLTLYAFSTENWNRPKYEIDALMKLLVQSIHEEMPRLMENNIRLLAIGDLGSLPAKSQAELKRAISTTESNTGLNLVLALSYSARWELLEASRKIARLAAQGTLDPESLDIPSYSSFLVTAGIPDPELLIRTSRRIQDQQFPSLADRLCRTLFYSYPLARFQKR